MANPAVRSITDGLVLKGKKRTPAESMLLYVVEFSCTYEATIKAIQHEAEGCNRRVIPAGWIEKESQCMQDMCWIRFESEEPFSNEWISRVRRWLDQIDQACHIMIES